MAYMHELKGTSSNNNKMSKTFFRIQNLETRMFKKNLNHIIQEAILCSKS
jgi:hypothetical protein